jgi:hypothetical protein
MGATSSCERVQALGFHIGMTRYTRSMHRLPRFFIPHLRALAILTLFRWYPYRSFCSKLEKYLQGSITLELQEYMYSDPDETIIRNHMALWRSPNKSEDVTGLKMHRQRKRGYDPADTDGLDSD